MKTDEHIVGLPDATITLVEYGDYECGYCGRAYLVLQVVLAELGDSVRYVFRNFPLSEIHPHAMKAAEAAESVAVHAGESAFWAMHAMLFENQDALEIDDLLGYADAAGADIEKVAADLSTGAMRPRVEQHVRLGMQEGVSGTPTLFLNGRRFQGDWTDADGFTAALQAMAREGALH
jgi:protein-disulfide isomerase